MCVPRRKTRNSGTGEKKTISSETLLSNVCFCTIRYAVVVGERRNTLRVIANRYETTLKTGDRNAERGGRKQNKTKPTRHAIHARGEQAGGHVGTARCSRTLERAAGGYIVMRMRHTQYIPRYYLLCITLYRRCFLLIAVKRITELLVSVVFFSTIQFSCYPKLSFYYFTSVKKSQIVVVF